MKSARARATRILQPPEKVLVDRPCSTSIALPASDSYSETTYIAHTPLRRLQRSCDGRAWFLWQPPPLMQGLRSPTHNHVLCEGQPRQDDGRLGLCTICINLLEAFVHLQGRGESCGKTAADGSHVQQALTASTRNSMTQLGGQPQRRAASLMVHT